MAELLTEKGYLATKQKLANMEARLAALSERNDLHPSHRAAVEHSYRDMMRQYLRNIKLYEAAHGLAETRQAPPEGPVKTAE